MKILKLALSASFAAFAALASAQTTSGNDSIYHLPYKDTYVKQAHVAENTFRVAKPQFTTLPKDFKAAKNVLPVPIWAGHQQEINMYWKAWEIAVRNIRNPQPGSGFVMPYIDTAYNGNIFMWDDSFILMFGRYGDRFFKFQNTLDNFYAKQHPDGFICREIKADGSDCFERYDPTSTGPNIMAWSEIMYYKQFGDVERLHKIFPALVSYNHWLQLNHTWRNGTYWSSGWGTGMDNMPRVKSEYNPIYSHGHMIWLDTNLQQIMVANQLLEIGFLIERWQEIETLEDEIKSLTAYVRSNLWDEKTGFLYDQYADGSLCSTKGISAFWALQSDVLTKDQLDRLVKHLSDTTEFCRPGGMVPSLSADHPKYNPRGRYWQGGIWPGASYMVINGLYNKGYREEARRVALANYKQVFEVFKKTGTFWEYYAPEALEEGFMARKDFIGWTGLAPISELIEYIIGIQADYTKEEITWDVNLLEENGIERYPYGPEGLINFKAAARKRVTDRPALTINSNVPFTLKLRYGTAEETIQVTPSQSKY